MRRRRRGPIAVVSAVAGWSTIGVPVIAGSSAGARHRSSHYRFDEGRYVRLAARRLKNTRATGNHQLMLFIMFQHWKDSRGNDFRLLRKLSCNYCYNYQCPHANLSYTVCNDCNGKKKLSKGGTRWYTCHWFSGETIGLLKKNKCSLTERSMRTLLRLEITPATRFDRAVIIPGPTGWK